MKLRQIENAGSGHGDTAAAALTPSRRRGLKWATGAAAVVVLFGGGVAVGAAATDPTASAECASRQELEDALRSQRDEAQASFDELNGWFSSRESALDSREAAAKANMWGMGRGWSESTLRPGRTGRTRR